MLPKAGARQRPPGPAGQRRSVSGPLHVLVVDDNADVAESLGVLLDIEGTQDDCERTRDAGFDRHLTKPAELPAVEELLRAAAQARSAA
jgi:CheY-like chemotaxis protein